MYNKINEIVKKLNGNVLAVGLDEKLINTLYKNDNISLYSISKSLNNQGLFKKTKKRINNKGKSINIKKLRKYINKNSVKYIVCNMNEMIDYYKYFIKDSIYINNNTIYIYSDNSIDSGFIINKYKRYNVEIEITNYKSSYIIKINNKNGKNNFFKDKLYLIKDTFYNIAEYIGNILIG